MLNKNGPVVKIDDMSTQIWDQKDFFIVNTDKDQLLKENEGFTRDQMMLYQMMLYA